MSVDAGFGDIGRAIQLAITPVFLLTGLAAMLGVITGRLARVIDRARAIEAGWPALDVDAKEIAKREITNLEHRRRVCSWSINFCTLAALLVCLVIVTLFADEIFDTRLTWLVGFLFIAAMVCLICGLAWFLREVYLATHLTVIDHDRFK
jgi:hypothetical protein